MLRHRKFTRIAIAALALTLSACGQATQTAPDGEAPSAVDQAPSSATTAPDTQFCAEVGRRVSAQDCSDLSALADQAQTGVAAFNAPNPMQRGEVHTLQLAIGYAPTPEEAAERARQEEAEAQLAREQVDGAAPSDVVTTSPAPPPGPPTPEETVDPLQGETETFTPLVGRFMRAELVGNGFEITPLSEASQEVLPDSVTTWTWRVEAKEGGQRALTLRTVVEGCTATGQCYPLRSTSQNYDVTVQVGTMGQVRDLLTAAPVWLRLLGGVLAALAVLIGAYFSLRGALRKGRSG